MAPAEVVLTWCQSPQEWTCQGDEVPGSLPQGALVHSAPWVLEEAVEKAPSPLSEHLLHPAPASPVDLMGPHSNPKQACIWELGEPCPHHNLE